MSTADDRFAIAELAALYMRGRRRDGAKAARKGAQTLGNHQEARIRQLHLTLDAHLAG